MTQLQLFMILQKEATIVQQLRPKSLNLGIAVTGCCQQRTSVLEKFLLHDDEVNSPVFSPPLLQSHDCVKFL